MSTVFSKIINGDLSAYIIDEDDKHIAFLDVSPLTEGHTLVIPKKEIDLIFDMDQEDFKDLWGFAQKVSKKIAKAIPCKRVGTAVVGLEVPHAHIHLVPLNSIGDLNFETKRKEFTAEEFQETADKIKNA